MALTLKSASAMSKATRPATRTVRPVAARKAVVVRASVPAAADKRAAAVSAGVTAATLSMLSSPLAAQAAVTPSLRNLIYSLVAGGVVLGAIAVAVTAVSSFDPVKRG